MANRYVVTKVSKSNSVEDVDVFTGEEAIVGWFKGHAQSLGLDDSESGAPFDADEAEAYVEGMEDGDYLELDTERGGLVVVLKVGDQ